ncbi:MAG: glutamate synthase subunit beta [Desulfobacterales bacterium]|nr:glutamate synthase subunit beta [Desulfobacterales bacterium]
MGDPKGFQKYSRQTPKKRNSAERINDFSEIYAPFARETLRQQAARCMSCGVPTCHAGCPLGNLIPDWNHAVYRGQWQKAVELLHRTNNFPEFTGRLCPAPCEPACVLAINEPPVTIEAIEKEIIEFAFAQGWVKPEPPEAETGKSLAIAGSGPAGLACAQQLCRAGHSVTVFERADRIGGLLRYGIPDFKMDKQVLDRRLAQMRKEGVRFETGVDVGRDLGKAEIAAFDAVVYCIGTTVARDLQIPGRELDGIHFAMDFLTQQNRRLAEPDFKPHPREEIHAKDKRVIVIGGGDTGSDCTGTCHRQGAASVVNFELMPRPPETRPEQNPWPFWPLTLRTSPSHEEGGERHWGILTKEFVGEQGRVTGLKTVHVRLDTGADGRRTVSEIPGTEQHWPADLVLLAMGFTGPETAAVSAQSAVVIDGRGHIQTDEGYMTNVDGVFAAGDARRGQSLIVWAIFEGREAARAVDIYLTGTTRLPSKGEGDLEG